MHRNLRIIQFVKFIGEIQTNEQYEQSSKKKRKEKREREKERAKNKQTSKPK